MKKSRYSEAQIIKMLQAGEAGQMSERQACRLVGLSRTWYRYQSSQSDDELLRYLFSSPNRGWERNCRGTSVSHDPKQSFSSKPVPNVV